ncbi:MAG: hypothetical protein FJZ92_03075 [Chloroflexi bacterium]|nr:hypothetical protein [Chloroflexota bacterium]
MFDHSQPQQVRALLFRLLLADREEVVEEVLKSVDLWDDRRSWRLLGDRPDNYGTAGAQAAVPEAALVEKITNAIERFKPATASNRYRALRDNIWTSLQRVQLSSHAPLCLSNGCSTFSVIRSS